MPVEDHPVHERVKVSLDFRYGCFNRPAKFKPVVRGAAAYGSQEWPFVMSHACKYGSLKLTDGFCAGCVHQGVS